MSLKINRISPEVANFRMTFISDCKIYKMAGSDF